MSITFALCGNLFYFLILAKLKSVGITPPTFMSLKRMIAMFNLYSEMAPGNGWPRWWVKAFGSTVALAFLSAIAIGVHLK
jgi:hypothetical protein